MTRLWPSRRLSARIAAMVSAMLRSSPIDWLQPSSALARALLTFVTLPRMVATSAGVNDGQSLL